MNQIKLEDEKENIDSNLWTKFIQSVSIIKKIEEKKDSIFMKQKHYHNCCGCFYKKVIFQEIFEE